ncbi:WD40/YVTN/BNR-like repeat-containing protein [Paenibacillus beijingensis]|uniref:Photosynthesis system II assembly factor Ycf48/Hcf136-like domain-containing protein n=1 Tax=Paenibacillus beijingensis TaxID=1126833 RepID=A0A0D5NNW7_9BACL|nr:sialidase family protein [Paenibacillus beijingensis]AJY76687.1 hypothetical protein VN24_21575 [Paenibacillus beijingensis]
MSAFFRRSAVSAAVTLALGITSAIPATQVAAESSSVCRTDDHGLFNGKPAGDGYYHFSDVNFLSKSTGRAAGNGFLIGTSDAGCSWQNIYKGTWQFSQLDFVSNTTGWALAKSSETGPNALIYTKDGGSHFTKIPTGEMNLERIHFTDSRSGFGYSRIYAYRTTDSGITWTKIATPPNNRYAQFADSKSGWSLVVVPGTGYKLMKTTDGGKSWTTKLTVKSEEISGGAVYTDGSRVWALFNGGVGMSQMSYSLYASTDSGASWRKVISQDTSGGGPAPGGAKGVADEGPASPGSHPGNMQLLDGAAILAGYSGAAEKAGVGRSLDGGKSWTNLSTVHGFENRISFTSPDSGWMAVTSISDSAVYSTRDGGRSWTKTISLPNPD